MSGRWLILAWVGLLHVGCLGSSTWANPNLDNSLLWVEPANVALDGQSTAQVEVVLQQSSGMPIAGVKVVLQGDGCTVLQATGATDAHGHTQAQISTCEPGTHGIYATLMYQDFTARLPMHSLVNFYTPVPGTSAVPAGAPLNVAAHPLATAGAYGPITGTVHFISSDPHAVLPPDYTMTPADHGAATLVGAASLTAAGIQTITAIDTGTEQVISRETLLIAPSGPLTVGFAAVPGTQAGAAQTLTVQVTDSQAQINAAFTGTVLLLSSTPAQNLPASVEFTLADAGSMALAGVRFSVAGPTLLSAATAGVSGSTTTVMVAPGPAVRLQPSALTRTPAGVSQLVTVTALDAFGNVALDVASTLQLTCSDRAAQMPAGAVVAPASAGIWRIPVTFYSAGSQFLQAEDPGDPSLVALLSNLVVTAGAAQALSIDSPGQVTAGAPVVLQVAVRDAYGNMVPDYAGAVQIICSDAQANLPGALVFDSTDEGHINLLSAQFYAAGTTRLAAVDNANVLQQSVQFVNVQAASATTLRLETRSPSPYLQPSDVTVTVQDNFNNVTSNYTGTVHFISSDPQAQLPADVTFGGSDAGRKKLVNGVTFATVGVHTLSAADLVNNLQGAQTGIVVHQAVQLTVAKAGQSVCVLFNDGLVKCWGNNDNGQLGLGDTGLRGIHVEDMGAALPYVALGAGRHAVQVSMGDAFACAVLDNGQVKCWGSNESGQLGLGDTVQRGSSPNQMGDMLPAVNLGSQRVAQWVSAGQQGACASLDNQQLKCWGVNTFGQLGLGDNFNRGLSPGQMGDSLPAVQLGTGRTAQSMGMGALEVCAILDDGGLKCWGINNGGELGVGDQMSRGAGPGQMGDNLPEASLGTGRTVRTYDGGNEMGCALLDDATVKCWGVNRAGELGYGDTLWRGNSPGTVGAGLPAVDLGTGRTAFGVACMNNPDACVWLDDGTVKCWGPNLLGQLGLGDLQTRGGQSVDMGDGLPALMLGTGRRVNALAAGQTFVCALLDHAQVKCWGDNALGQLGLGDLLSRGANLNQMGDALPTVLW